jgi:hypothetical protein
MYQNRGEINEFAENVNSSIVKGLRSGRRRVNCTTKIQISTQLHNFLKSRYGLRFGLAPCPDFLDDLRIIRAHFLNEREYARAAHFKFAIRKSRRVVYHSIKNGKLTSKYFTASPYFVVHFFRVDKKIQFN